jgi:hypothetical protein
MDLLMHDQLKYGEPLGRLTDHRANRDPDLRPEVQRGMIPPVIAARHKSGATVASVCTGAFLLAAGGLLDGRPATTHHDDFDDLEADAAEVLRDARVVDDGDIVTSGGVTAGIDMALWVVEKYKGSEVADRVAAAMEYRRNGKVWLAGGALPPSSRRPGSSSLTSATAAAGVGSKRAGG